MSGIVLRGYQVEAIDSAERELVARRRALLDGGDGHGQDR
jgi:hypothetical protein